MLTSKISLKGRHFLTLKDFTPEEIQYLLDLSADLKAKKKAGVLTDSLLRGKNIALIFECYSFHSIYFIVSFISTNINFPETTFTYRFNYFKIVYADFSTK